MRLDTGDPLVVTARELVQGDAPKFPLGYHAAARLGLAGGHVHGSDPNAVIDLLETAEVFLGKTGAKGRNCHG